MFVVLLLTSILLVDSLEDKVTIANVGTIALPRGKWRREYGTPDRVQKRSDKMILVFKRIDVRHNERLSFEFFPPDDNLSIGCYFDGVADSYSRGLPFDIVNEIENEYQTEIVRPVEKLDGKKALWSTVKWCSEKKPDWIAHHFSAYSRKWVVLCVHSSEKPLTAKPLKLIYAKSTFTLKPAAKRE